MMLVALIGQPNSGKSAVLSRLTGARVVTSNYPGTTVELYSGILQSGYRILDTPGIYSLHAVTLEQKVTRDVLWGSDVDLIVNVVDGSNLARHLSLTLALIDAQRDRGIPMIVNVNCVDRVRDAGLEVDAGRLREVLGLPVILTSAATGEGMEQLADAILKALPAHGRQDTGGTKEPPRLQDLQRRATDMASAVLRPVSASENTGSALQRRRRPASVLRKLPRATAIESALDRPLWAFAALGAVLAVVWRLMAWALPWAESGVRLLTGPLEAYLSRFLESALPQSRLSPVIAESLTEGLVLPLATVLPAMVVAYSLMAFLEDTGLLARYAAMGDSLFGALGLPGQALIPFMLGFGCRVPGLLSVRILPSEKARRTASVLIAALVPCTATVSLAWATLARFGGNPLVPCAALSVSAVGLSKILRLAGGEPKDSLVLELPPLRLPALRNVAMKTHLRLTGFFTHVLPLVVALNVAIKVAVAGAAIPDGGACGLSRDLFGIPPQALVGVLMTMLQRYLAPLFLLQRSLTPREATIAVTMVVLGFPCLPSAATLWREQGPGAVLATVLASTCLFAGWGALLNLVLP